MRKIRIRVRFTKAGALADLFHASLTFLRAPLRHLPLLFIAVALALPVAALVGAWLPGLGASAPLPVLQAMAQTVLPGYLWTTLWLALGVGVGTAVVGTASAVAVTLFEFRGRRVFEWLLLLPLAMPAYVTAYAYTDFLQFSGPLQTWVRTAFELEGRVLPEVRSLPGAIVVFVVSLYPYVYLLSRAALAERLPHLLDAARLLGASPIRRILQVVLPLARPAIAAGVALALMETLADFGVTSYFGIQTFSTAIINAWLSMDDRRVAAQLSTMLLAFVLVLLWLERRAQRRMRFAGGAAAGKAVATSTQLLGWQAVGASAICALPVLLGFFAPVAFMLRPLAADWSVLPWQRFLEWGWNSVRLGGVTSLIAVALALFLAFSLRRKPSGVALVVARVVGVGYAVPGAVIVVGLLVPVAWVQQHWPAWGVAAVVTTTSVGIVWAYLVRFSAVALQSMESGYLRISTSLDESARLLGAGDARLLREVHWPLLKRATLAAGLLVFVDVMKELPATMVLRPFNSDTLAVVAYQLTRDERLGEAALPSLALVLVGLVPVMLLSRALRTR